MPAEQMMAALRPELIVAERFLSREEAKGFRLNDCRPIPTLGADRAVALPCAGTQVNVGFEAHCTAVTTSLKGLHHVSATPL
jgi:hypothetical protein